jgi:ribosome-associated heat shock protein Hsp15
VADAGATDTLRIDRWLWFARFFKSRTTASKLVESGKLRLNRAHIAKTHAALKIGDVLTFPQGNEIRVIKVLALGERRGPASEARLLYEDLSPPLPRSERAPEAPPPGRREPGAGRPTKAERRAIDRLRGED